jgi:hypothetical protein
MFRPFLGHHHANHKNINQSSGTKIDWHPYDSRDGLGKVETCSTTPVHNKQQ